MSNVLNQAKYIWPVFKREFAGYFATPLAYVFIVIFLLATGSFTFYVGNFFDNNIADLAVFFGYHPWLYLFLVPAISMRLWAEERRTGTMELLLTLPVPVWATVVGKFLAAWIFTGIALFLTFPIWITVNYLGSPDNGAIVAAYVGRFLMAGGVLAKGLCLFGAPRTTAPSSRLMSAASSWRAAFWPSACVCRRPRAIRLWPSSPPRWWDSF